MYSKSWYFSSHKCVSNLVLLWVAFHNVFFQLTLHQSLETFKIQSLFLVCTQLFFEPFPHCCFQSHSLQKRRRTPTSLCFLSSLQVLIFVHTTKNWKYNRLLLTYLWTMSHLRRKRAIYLNWESEWKIPVEERYFQ